MASSSQALDPFIPSKSLAHIDRFDELLRGRLPAPVTVEIDLADGFCNHACPHCFFSTPTKARPVFFPYERARTLAFELKNAGVRAIEFPGGGEPTTHPKFAGIVREFGAANLPMGLVSNGQLFSKILPVLSIFEWVRISVDAGDAASFRAAHGVDRFERVVSGVRALAAAAQVADTKVGVGFLVTPANWKTIRTSVSLFQDLGLAYLQFRPASKVLWPRDAFERAREDVLSLRELEPESGMKIVVSEHKWQRSKVGRAFPQCQTSALVGIIGANGRMPFCCLKRGKMDEELGSVLTHRFEEVWFGDTHQSNYADVDHKSCPLPCKHDAYNEVFYALKARDVSVNFL